MVQVCQDVLVRLSRALETCDDPDIDTSDSAPSPAPSSSNGHIATALQNGRDSPGEGEEKKSTNGFLLTPDAVVIVCAVLSLCIKRLQKQGTVHFFHWRNRKSHFCECTPLVRVLFLTLRLCLWITI